MYIFYIYVIVNILDVSKKGLTCTFSFICNPLTYSRQVGGAKGGAEMSKTDNTRPMLVQWDDMSKPARIHHGCSGGWMIPRFHRCDYDDGNNMRDYHDNSERHVCKRIPFVYGGKRSYGGRGKPERKLRQRRLRRRERAALYQVRASNFDEDFDLKPIREDNNTLEWDLS